MRPEKACIQIDAGELGELDIDIEYTYFAGEPESFECEGEPEELEILSAVWGDIDMLAIINKMIDDETLLEKIRESQA